MPDPREVADVWVEAFNRGDADAMVALYSEDAIHTSPKLRAVQPAGEGRIKGKAAMKGWWQDAFERRPGIKYEVLTIVASDEVAVIEYLRHSPGEDTMQVAEVFEIRDGLIVRSHVYHG